MTLCQFYCGGIVWSGALASIPRVGDHVMFQSRTWVVESVTWNLAYQGSVMILVRSLT